MKDLVMEKVSLGLILFGVAVAIKIVVVLIG